MGSTRPDCEEACGATTAAVGFDMEDQELQRRFDIVDSDGDGFITSEELCTVLARQGVKDSSTVCQVEIAKWDRLEKDGKLSFQEFKIMMDAMERKERRRQKQEEKIKTVFA